MRIRVVLDNPDGVTLPVNHQDQLTGVAYGLLGASDAAFARFLHDYGYPLDDGPKRFKLFTFSSLRSRRRRVEGPLLRLGPGPVEWLIASPVPEFLTHCATGLLAAGTLRVHRAEFAIRSVETLPAPDFSRGYARFSCMSPIVASVRSPDGGTRYLRPTEGASFSEAVRLNLIRKHETLYSAPPADETLRLAFDVEYLASHRGTKKITYKGIDIIGAFGPFVVEGSDDLLSLAHDAGFGEKNAAGFGMVEVSREVRDGNPVHADG